MDPVSNGPDPHVALTMMVWGCMRWHGDGMGMTRCAPDPHVALTVVMMRSYQKSYFTSIVFVIATTLGHDS